MAEEKNTLQEENAGQTQTEKSKRVHNALKVGAIVLLVVLLALLIYQVVAIIVTKNKYDELISKIQYYEQRLEEGSEYEERVADEEWIIKRAHELGYWFENDRIGEEFMKPVK